MPKSRGVRPWSWMVLALSITTSLEASDVKPASKCCPGDAIFFTRGIHCSDNSTIQLSCNNSWWMLNTTGSEESMSTVTIGNETYLHVKYRTDIEQYSPEDYCLAKLNSTSEEVALICFPAGMQWESREDDRHYQTVFEIMCLVSSAFFALTFIIYLCLKELRDLQDKALMSMVAAFAVAYFVHGLQNFKLSYLMDSSQNCMIMASLMYYAYMSGFFWLNIISLNIWRHVWSPKLKIRNSLLFAIYCIIGWGMPLLLLVITLISNQHKTPELRASFADGNVCWFSERYPRWIYFYDPIAVLLILDLLYLASTGYKLWHQYSEIDCCKMKILRFKFQMLIKLAVIMGFLWIFEVISFALEPVTSRDDWIVTDLLNESQGVFIFILLVVTRAKVRKLLAQSRPCGIIFPKSWAALGDKEVGQFMGPEEFELSDEECESVKASKVLASEYH